MEGIGSRQATAGLAAQRTTITSIATAPVRLTRIVYRFGSGKSKPLLPLRLGAVTKVTSGCVCEPAPLLGPEAAAYSSNQIVITSALAERSRCLQDTFVTCWLRWPILFFREGRALLVALAIRYCQKADSGNRRVST
jgi:hypothetical protein